MVETEFIYSTNIGDDDLIDQDLLDPIMTESQYHALEQLEAAILTGDEIKISNSYHLESLSKNSLREKRTIVAKARQRLIIYHIIKKSIERRDDLTICNWYDEAGFRGSRLFSTEELEQIAIALKRKQALAEFRQAISNRQIELAIQIYNLADLEHSSLFLDQDRQSLNSILKELGQHKSNDESKLLFDSSNQIEPSSYSEEQLAQLWLIGKFTISQFLDHKYSQDQSNIVKQIGFNIRIKRALLKKDKKQLLSLIHLGNAYGYSLADELKEDVAALLEEGN